MGRSFTDPQYLTRLLVASGVLLRVWHYAANHTIWYDEAVLLDNVLSKGYARLLGPLDNEVAAPPLFLWLLKTMHLLLGDEPYLWRAVPFACSVGGLLLSVPLARKTLDPPAAAFAVGLVAVSDNHVWLGCTVKPYAGDALVATALILYLVATDRRPITRRLLGLAAVAPIALGLSYPAAFVLGGVLLALAPLAWRKRGSGPLAWLLAAGSATATFAALYFGPVKAQRVTKLVNEWARDYPTLADPVSVPWWLIDHTFGVFQQACNPSGVVLPLVAPVGVWVLWRTDRRPLAVACLGTFALVLLAAAVRSYPYGQSRLMLFIAPVAGLLAAAGMGELFRRTRWAGWAAVLVLLVAGGLSASHLVRPWHRPDAQAVHRHVQAHRRPGDAILSDEGNYLYFFHGEVRPLAAGAGVPVGGRAWVVMDHYTDEVRRAHVESKLAPLGFELREDAQFFQAAAYLYVRTR